MKIIVTCDWHIKLGQKNVPVAWQKNRFRMFFEFLAAMSAEVDAIVIAGDIFDKAPTLEELDLFNEFLLAIKHANNGVQVIIISGNHEAQSKKTTFLSSIKISSHAIYENTVIIDSMCSFSGMDFIPYNELSTFVKLGFTYDKNRILVTHVRGEIPPHVQPEIDLDLLNDWDLVLAGDLHSHSNSQRNIVYPGSPMTTSFHREETKTGVLLVDTDTLEYEMKYLDLPQLIRKTVSSQDEIVQTPFHHTMYELEGVITDLAQVKSSEFLDKKVVRKDSVSTLNLLNMTVQEELAIYLNTVQKLPEEKTAKIVNRLNDNIAGIDLE